jgi:DNA-binding transcriptional LysR family regulator
MELRQLRYLVALAEEEHFTRAATRMRIAQPALSQQIRKLERELDVLLVERTTRSVRMTEAGSLLTARARRALAEVDEGVTELESLKGLFRGRVTIGITPTPGPFDLLRLLREFSAKYPGVDLAVREDLSATLADALREDSIDIGFLSLGDESRQHGLERRPLAEEPLVVAVPVGHRFAGRTRLRVADLKNEALVSFMEGATIRDAVDRATRAAGFTPRIAFETREVARAREIVAAGLGISILARSDADRPGPEVRIVALRDPTLTHRISLCWRQGRRQTPASRALLDQARELSLP